MISRKRRKTKAIVNSAIFAETREARSENAVFVVQDALRSEGFLLQTKKEGSTAQLRNTVAVSDSVVRIGRRLQDRVLGSDTACGYSRTKVST